VAIVGRGPVGMTLGLLLAKTGIRSLIADRLGEQIPLMSKAVLMHGASAEILGRAGIGTELLQRGVALAASRTFVGKSELFHNMFPPPVPGGYPRLLNFPQSETEALLLERVQSEPLIDLRLESDFASLQQFDAGVVSRFAGPEGPFEVRSSYLVGCDGSRSSVRKQLPIAFGGHTHNDHYLIVDIRAKLPYAAERRFAFDPPSSPGRTVLIHPQHDDLWHIDFQVGAAPDLDAEHKSGKLDARIRAVIGDEIDYEIASMTTYVFKQLIADRFAYGRAFLVGDAAHLYAPYGARGLNSGLADADNLAWKLACVLHGEAPAALLNTYDIERRAAANRHFQVTARTARFMAPTTRAGKVRRDLTLAVAQRISAFKRFVDSGHFYQPVGYPTSPIVAADGSSDSARLLAGEALPEVALGDQSGHPRRLRGLAGDAFVMLHVAPSAEHAVGARDAMDKCALPNCARVVSIVASRSGHVEDRNDLMAVPADAFGELCARLGAPNGLVGAGRVLVVRPDLHIASCHDLTDPSEADAISDWLARALGHRQGRAAGSRYSRKGGAAPAVLR
jgi:3-(3-hydroxy-phenyl)propionate hydroxylase